MPPATPGAANAWQGPGTSGTAVPYAFDQNNNGTFVVADDSWANDKSFQIISAGLDGVYGVAGQPPAVKFYPKGTGYDPGGTDSDNTTNFCDRSILDDAKP